MRVIYLIKKSNDPRAPVDPTPNECWKGGMIYYNPNDAALFVARRDGVGFTANMANPWSWVMLGSSSGADRDRISGACASARGTTASARQ